MNNYERLSNAIVLQAVKDYREAKKKLAKGRKNCEATRMKEECKRFFRSEWFKCLTEIAGEFLIKRLDDEEVDDDC